MITRVRKLLLEQDLSLRQLQPKLGIHRTTMSRYSLGYDPILNAHLVLLCRYFNCPPEQVLGYIDEADILDYSDRVNPRQLTNVN